MLLVGGLVYYLSYASLFPFNLQDEGYLLYIAYAFSQGQVPYQDVQLFSYLPGLFYLFTAVMKWSGPDVFWLRLVMLTGLLVTPWLLYRTAIRFTGPRIALGVAVAVLLVPGPWHKFYVGLFGVASLYCLLRMLITRSASWGAAMGVILAGAFVVRIDIALATLGLVITAAVLEMWSSDSSWPFTWKPYLWIAGMIIVIVGPWLIWLAAHGAFVGHWQQWVNFVPMILARTATTSKLKAPLLTELLRLDYAGATAWLFYGSLIPVTVLAMLVLVRVFRKPLPGPPRRDMAILALVVLWTISSLPQYTLERPDVPHLTQRAFSFFLPLAVVLQMGLNRARGSPPRVYKVAALVLAVLLSVYSVAYVAKHLAWGQGGSIGVVRTPVTWHRLANGISFPEVSGAKIAELTQHIIRNSRTIDRLASLPYLPGINFLAQRLMPDRQVFLLRQSVDPVVEQDFIAALDRWSVPFVVYIPRQIANPGPSNLLENFAPRVHAFLRLNYEKVMEADDRDPVELLARRNNRD